MMDSWRRGASRGVSPVIGVVLMVAITVVLAATVGAMMATFDDETQGAPQYTAVTIDGVQKSSGPIHVPTSETDDCEHFHLVLEMTPLEGASLDSTDLEYYVEVSGDDGTTLSGRFTESVARSGVSASAGEQIVIALDSDTDEDFCGGPASDSKSTVLFGGEPAWHQDEAGQVGGLYDIHNTFLSASETLTEVHVRIVHTPSDTIIVDETADDIEDVPDTS